VVLACSEPATNLFSLFPKYQATGRTELAIEEPVSREVTLTSPKGQINDH
jgi:hypothetical protein